MGHCHYLYHMAAGMFATLVYGVRVERIRVTNARRSASGRLWPVAPYKCRFSTGRTEGQRGIAALLAWKQSDISRRARQALWWSDWLA